jgi:fructose-1,6-bisphosphatase/inositol monophosphatase family enzyme
MGSGTFRVKNEAGDAERCFIEVFRIAALQVESIARRLQSEVSLQTKPGQASAEGAALTSVDLAAQDVILQLLHAALPEVAVDAEEDTDTLQLFPPAEQDRPLVVVDPIDGTLNYARGSKDYAVMGALIHDGIYRAAVVHFPAWQQLYWARRRRGCWQQIKDDHARQIHLEGSPPKILVASSVPKSRYSNLKKIGFEVQVSHCSAVDSSAPVMGRAAAAISMGKLGRRRAIGLLLTLEAGGVVKINGRDWQAQDPLSLSERRGPIVAADSEQTATRILSVLK